MPSAGRHTRTATLVTLAVALVVGGSLAAGLHVADSREPVAPADRVPATVDYVGYADPDTARTDPAMRNATLFSFRFQSATVFYSGPDFARSYAFGRHDGPDPAAAEWVVYFGRSNGSAYDARVVRANWTARELVAAVERDRNVTLSRGEYRDRTLYAGDGRAVSVLADGTFAVGNASAVRDAVDVHVGRNRSLSGPLRERFQRETGFVRLAHEFRPETVPRYIPFVGDSVRRVEYVGASYTLNGSNLAVTANATATDEEGARAVAGIVNAGITFYRFETTNASVRAEVGKVRLSREGRVVRVRYESAPSNYEPFLRSLYRNQPER